MKKNLLITTGGSGGHVLPAKIIFEHLSKDKNVIISTDRRGLKYLEKDIYQFEIIIFASFDKCSYRMVAGKTWPPDPPVVIKKFFLILI